MTLSPNWLHTLTQPFPTVPRRKGKDKEREKTRLKIRRNLCGVGTRPGFKARYMSKSLKISYPRARRLSEVVHMWLHTLHSPVYAVLDAETKKRMLLCTKRFSSWNNKYHRCRLSKMCPWCRQYLIHDLYSKLVNYANRGSMVVVYQVGNIADRKRVSRPPTGAIASIKNIVYPTPDGDPVFQVTSFMRKKDRPDGVRCSEEQLQSELSLISWDFELARGYGIHDYLRLVDRMRYFSLNI